ncbi:transcription factor bHLH143-like isoform X2 [Cornus florida]|nr:transcription factor bHLH143-like isoform X2 [Cornus florida]
MEKDLGSWFQHPHSDWQSPNLNSLRSPLDLGQQNTIPPCMRPGTNMISTNGMLPAFPFSGMPHFKASHPNEPHGWFYCLPRYRQASTAMSNSVFKEKVIADPYENGREVVTPNPATGCAQKKFLVFDQSGDQTTLIFSSGIGTPPVQRMTSWMPKPPGAYDLNREEPGIKMDKIHQSGPILTDEHNENHRDDSESEMHEDTEELNALLYSDDNTSYSEDDEETSTGHSPSTVTAYDKHEWLEKNAEEVVSSAESTKRQKLSDIGYVVPSFVKMPSSEEPNKCFEYEADAESSCAVEKNQELGEFGSSLGNKMSRKEKIRETVSILRSIIPGGKGKDAIVVLDEAIHYLRSLKRKAKELGVNTL